MKIEVTESRVWWISIADEIRAERGVPIVDAVKAITERFKFASAPNQLPPGGEGLRFTEGSMQLPDRTITLKEAVFFTDGISIDVYSNTSDARAALDEILKFIRGALGSREPRTPPKISFNSRIVCDFDRDINEVFEKYAEFLRLMQSTLEFDGQLDLRILEFGSDTQMVKGGGGVFRIERRNGVPHSMNRYFSYATATTEQHVRLLEFLNMSASRKAA